RVTVVGAGPAGLECARVAATAGHQVTVIDREPATGATVRNWSSASGREPLASIVDWLESECRRLGVELQLGSEATADALAALHDSGHEVVLCTGGRPAPTGCQIDAASLLAGLSAGTLELPDGPVLVWDPVGGPVGVSVAETLAGVRPVVFVTPDVIPGTLLSLTGDLASASTRLLQAGVDIRKRQVLREVRRGEVELEDRFTGARATVAAELAVDCGHRLASDELWRATGEHLARAGDAVAPRSLHEAILEGRRLGRAVGGFR
ncbi:MAG: FAD-dependent oxidoreductase, partial [Acidimicrobiales bacterium]|nr:FAD-dependent oxidoreductase [Acidimicrobiales bacterium]